jgi:hypothetical protein
VEAAAAEEYVKEQSYQVEFRRHQLVERAKFELDYPRTEQENIKKALNTLAIEITDAKAVIQRVNLSAKRMTTAARSTNETELSNLRIELARLEVMREHYKNTYEQLDDRRQTIDPEKQVKLAQELERRNSKLEATTLERDKALLQTNQAREKYLDQEAYIFRAEIYEFTRKRRKRLSARKLANAIAGLPFVKCRRSHERLAKYKSKVNVATNYLVFKFLESASKRSLVKSKHLNSDYYRKEITNLPKTVVVNQKRIENRLRAHLANNWYYLEKAIKDSLSERVQVERLPYLIAAKFQKYILTLTTETTRLEAEREKITD